MKSFIVRLISFVLGLSLISFGVSLTIKAELGTGAWDALNVGLSKTVGLTVGSWVFIVGIVLIGLNAILLKTRPDFLAVFTIFLAGVFIDGWLLVVFDTYQASDLWEQIAVFIIGVIILSFGIAVYLQAKFPLIPIDKLMLAIQERLGVSMGVAKTIGELSALVAAFFFSGPIGLGTLIVTFTIGPLVQLFAPRVHKFQQRLQT
ncbi:YczE/YyaS/YitT family protein [Pseudalkalibacillus berkeleyi]|uniref:Membrane protein n=1 Tax=Pseudalkalibacillus berkeleyi TaxID=1069813 RepID=A0ABS9H4H1_9BACL|nr:membrane protein [Pseudalkalibacillus berkeleyi]MCF6138991.1 membrane protein [Pseudalkalibacillus berkeleyi]